MRPSDLLNCALYFELIKQNYNKAFDFYKIAT